MAYKACIKVGNHLLVLTTPVGYLRSNHKYVCQHANWTWIYACRKPFLPPHTVVARVQPTLPTAFSRGRVYRYNNWTVKRKWEGLQCHGRVKTPRPSLPLNFQSIVFERMAVARSFNNSSEYNPVFKLWAWSFAMRRLTSNLSFSSCLRQWNF